MKKQFAAFFDVAYVYWNLYGGFKALAGSPYFILAVIISVICYPLWSSDWESVALGSIPNLLGFSIGAFAVILSFGQNATELLKSPKESSSDYLSVVVAFVHFIIIQTLALLIGLVGKAWDTAWLGAIGTLVTAYAIALSVAAAFRLFRLARLYNQIKEKGAAKDGEGSSR